MARWQQLVALKTEKVVNSFEERIEGCDVVVDMRARYSRDPSLHMTMTVLPSKYVVCE
jgi:hypothetical protein